MILLVIGALFFFSLRSIERSNQSRATSKLALIDEMEHEVEHLQVEVLRQFLASDPAETKRLDLRVRDIGILNAGKLADYQQFVATEGERQLYERVMEAQKANWEQVRAVLASGGADRDAEAMDAINSKQAAAYDESLEAVNELHKYVEASAQDVATATTRFISDIRLIGTALAGIAICIAIGTGFAVAAVARRLREDNWTLKVEVAERKRAEETVRESEEKFRQLADNISDVFWVTSPDLRMNVNALNRHGIVLKREFQEVPAISIDKHKVLQVLVNLVRNAKYACEESGRADKQLTVRVTNGGEWLDISVIDNGVGVHRENLTRIFHHGFTTRKDGHGFGLHGGALAAKEMGGSLTVQSDGPGRGASFTLKLPSQPDARSQE